VSTELERRRLRAESLRSSKSLERRNFGVSEFEWRAADDTDDGKIHFQGYASLTEVPYKVGGFVETIQRGAFKRTLHDQPDVVFRVEHTGLPLARTRRPGSPDLPGELLLEETHRGLKVNATFDAEDDDAVKLRQKMRNGLITEMSFAFRTTDDDWSSDLSRRTVKTLSMHGGDVSAVVFGASPSTGDTTSIRSADADYELEVRSKYAAHELGKLGGEGKAFKRPDGGWSFPTATRADYDSAVKMVQLSGAAHNAVRRYLIGRAKAEGWPIPVNWGSDGSARSALVLPDFTKRAAQEIELLRVGRPSASAYEPKAGPADTSTRAKVRARRLTQEAEIATLRARA
jgi:HK97 family phage prohead protease